MSDILTDGDVDDVLARWERIESGEEEPPKPTTLTDDMLKKGLSHLSEADVKQWADEFETRKVE